METDNRISAKKVIWVVMLSLFIMVFLLSLLWSLNKQVKHLEKENIELNTRLQEAQSQYNLLTEEKYYLYNLVEKINNGFVSQTNSLIKLTKSFPKDNYIPIIVRDTITQHHGN